MFGKNRSTASRRPWPAVDTTGAGGDSLIRGSLPTNHWKLLLPCPSAFRSCSWRLPGWSPPHGPFFPHLHGPCLPHRHPNAVMDMQPGESSTSALVRFHIACKSFLRCSYYRGSPQPQASAQRTNPPDCRNRLSKSPALTNRQNSKPLAGGDLRVM